jgi:hypothetical protein
MLAFDVHPNPIPVRTLKNGKNVDLAATQIGALASTLVAEDILPPIVPACAQAALFRPSNK